MNTVGAHEIVVETPVHGMTLAQLPEEHIAHVLELFRDRILDLKQDRRLRYVSLFKDQHPPSPTPARARLFPGAWERRCCRNCWKSSFAGAARIS